MLTATTIGQQLPHFSLTTLSGQDKFLSDYRGDRNLVLLAVEKLPPELIAETRQRYGEVREYEAEVIAIAFHASAAPLDLPFPLLIDPSGKTRIILGEACAVVTDRFGQVERIWDETPPTLDDILILLAAIELRCPE